MAQVAMAAYSVYQGVQAGKAADKAQAARDAANAQQTQIGIEDRQYYRDKYGPMNQMLVDYAMGNKPSPYLAQAKGNVEKGYQSGMRQLDEMAGVRGMGQSGIGAGQKIGLSMERAKALAGLNLQDQAQRYGVAQALSGQENMALHGSDTAAKGYSAAAGYQNQDMATQLGYQNSAFASAASNIKSFFTDGGFSNLMGGQTSKVESGGTKPSGSNPSGSNPAQESGVGLGSGFKNGMTGFKMTMPKAPTFSYKKV